MQRYLAYRGERNEQNIRFAQCQVSMIFFVFFYDGTFKTVATHKEPNEWTRFTNKYTLKNYAGL